MLPTLTEFKHKEDVRKSGKKRKKKSLQRPQPIIIGGEESCKERRGRACQVSQKRGAKCGHVFPAKKEVRRKPVLVYGRHCGKSAVR